MFMEVVRMQWNDKRKEYEENNIMINPFHLVTIEEDEEDKDCCLVTFINGFDCYLKYTKAQFKKRIDGFLKENVLSKIYKEIKDQQN